MSAYKVLLQGPIGSEHEEVRSPKMITSSRASRKKAKKVSFKLPTNEDYIIKTASGNKGLGLFANRNFEVGEIVIYEWPMMKFTADRLTNEALFANMSSEKCARFTALKSAPPSEKISETLFWRLFSLNYFETPLIYPNGESVVCVYDEISRANHSCVPNTVNSYNITNAAMCLRAITPIQAGEEICQDYRGSHSGGTTVSRRAQISDHFGFHCECDSCKRDLTLPTKIRFIYAKVFNESDEDLPAPAGKWSEAEHATFQRVMQWSQNNSYRFRQILEGHKSRSRIMSPSEKKRFHDLASGHLSEPGPQVLIEDFMEDIEHCIHRNNSVGLTDEFILTYMHGLRFLLRDDEAFAVA